MPRKTGPYAQLKGTFWRHPRTATLSLAATGLHARAMSFCADHMTDGVFPRSMLSAWAPGAQGKKLLAELLERGVWLERDETQLEIRGWADHNITRAEYEQRKEQTRSRVQRYRGSDSDATGPPGNADVTRYTGRTERVTNALRNGRVTLARVDQDQDQDLSSGVLTLGDQVASSEIRGLKIATNTRPPCGTYAANAYKTAIEAGGGTFDAVHRYMREFASIERMTEKRAAEVGMLLGDALDDIVRGYLEERPGDNRRPDWWLEWVTQRYSQPVPRRRTEAAE